MKPLKVSIITAAYNSDKYIKQTLKSVRDQDYDDIEHVLVDGGSKDNTNDIIQSFSHVTNYISEPDKGIYDALNKGVNRATGDVIGFVHSDDYLHNEKVISQVAEYFAKNPSVTGVYADIVFINDDKNIVRYYSSKQWKFNHFKLGKMPAHPSFFARKEVYESYLFDTQYKIAADFDQMLRTFKDPEFKFDYLPIITTSMRLGGASTGGIKSNIRINKEILNICKVNGIRTNYLRIYSKYPSRILEFVKGRLGFNQASSIN
ncbi:MAG: glycosyltransferase [Bacteroidetes bacterium]|nr:glycosyltransferase [Bacteroidota bacterium]